MLPNSSCRPPGETYSGMCADDPRTRQGYGVAVVRAPAAGRRPRTPTQLNPAQHQSCLPCLRRAPPAAFPRGTVSLDRDGLGPKRTDDAFGQACRIAFASLRQTDDFFSDRCRHGSLTVSEF
jgi:hypothetical protein